MFEYWLVDANLFLMEVELHLKEGEEGRREGGKEGRRVGRGE